VRPLKGLPCELEASIAFLLPVLQTEVSPDIMTLGNKTSLASI
jgi:hypothetical protein